MSVKTLISVLLSTFASATLAASDSIIDGEFTIQPYELPADEGLPPNEQGFRAMTSIINEQRNELIIFGGLGNGAPSPPTPMNFNVFTLDLTKSPSEQQWADRGENGIEDEPVGDPWFTSTRGFIEINNNYYLSCNDLDEDKIWSFDPNTYQFTLLSESPLVPLPQYSINNFSDCCAVGVTIPNSRKGSENKEERIYILGGKNDDINPVPVVRYYSITHDEWEQVADLNVPRSHLGCATVEQKGEPLIYAISGGNSPEGQVLRSIEIYNVIEDEWTLYDDYLPAGRGRTRWGGVENIDNKYLLLIGGDANCTPGRPGSSDCSVDEELPVTWVDMIDVKRNNRFISGEDLIPQLKVPRHAPGTILRKRKGNNQQHKYMLYVTGGRTINEDGLGVLTTTEVLSFDRINVENIPQE